MMSKNLDKRHSFFANTKIRFNEMDMKLKEMGADVPKAVLNDWGRVDDQIQLAEKMVDSPDGEHEVGRAHSLLYEFTQSSVLAGMGRRWGGWKHKVREEQQAEHQRWAEYARERLAKKKRPLKHGDKAEIIRAVVKRFRVKTNTVDKRLRDMGVWE